MLPKKTTRPEIYKVQMDEEYLKAAHELFKSAKISYYQFDNIINIFN